MILRINAGAHLGHMTCMGLTVTSRVLSEADQLITLRGDNRGLETHRDALIHRILLSCE